LRNLVQIIAGGVGVGPGRRVVQPLEQKCDLVRITEMPHGPQHVNLVAAILSVIPIAFIQPFLCNLR